MFDVSKPFKGERLRDFHTEAPAAKHEYRLRHYGPLRMAGAVWEETLREKLQKAARARYKETKSEFSVGFAAKDKFGPDDSYQSRESLSNIPDPKDYKIQ